ncbi:hypothetical protein Tco_0666505 [Tanacetum coccineum]
MGGGGGGFVGDFCVIDDHLGNDDLLEINEISCLARTRNGESAKELWDSLESKYMAEDASSKKFLVSNFNNYEMVDSSVIDKLPPSWKDFKHTLKHGKDDLSLVQLGSHLRIEESLKAPKSDKGKGKEVVGPYVNMTKEGGKNKNNKQNKGKKRGFNENNGGSGSNKKPKLEC